MKKRQENGTSTSRRKFLRSSMLGSVAAIAALRTSPSFAGLATQEPEQIGLEELTIHTIQSMMERGTITGRMLTEQYLARIQKIDKKGPAVNSIIELNPDALTIADALDQERKSKGPRGPLHGIPILIKDNIDTSDKMMTTAGSLALVGSKPAKDAFIVQRLREAGAVILGKTNLSEWANFRSTHSSSGWSGRGGQTRNPYSLERNPCGSSSGSGVAVAANLCAVAVGTETDGSIVCPSSSNGVVGIKPTVGLISRSGIIPIAHNQDTAGPMARTVEDAAILLSVLVGVDSEDGATNASKGKSFTDYTKFLDANGLKGARIGVARKFFSFNDSVDKLMNEAIDLIKKSGATVVDPADLPTHGKYDDSEFEVLLYEFKTDINKYLSRLGPDFPMKTLKDLIDFNGKNRDKEMPYFGQEIFIKAEAKGPLTDAAYKKALAKDIRMSRKEGIDALMNKHKLDAIIAPTGGPAWTTDLINGDHFTGGSSTPAAVAGYPNIQVPAGFAFGLPVGISFFGRAWSEPTLIKLAYAYEQATKFRRPPQFLPETKL